MDIRMDLARILIRETEEQQIIILRERDGDRHFPIVIGIYEATAIDNRVKGIKRERPMTHDLMASIIEALNSDLEKIVIHDLRDHTFYAKLIIRQNGQLVEVDARPSDAIALGIVDNTPIFVAQHVLDEVA